MGMSTPLNFILLSIILCPLGHGRVLESTFVDIDSNEYLKSFNTLAHSNAAQVIKGLNYPENDLELNGIHLVRSKRSLKTRSTFTDHGRSSPSSSSFARSPSSAMSRLSKTFTSKLPSRARSFNPHQQRKGQITSTSLKSLTNQKTLMRYRPTLTRGSIPRTRESQKNVNFKKSGQTNNWRSMSKINTKSLSSLKSQSSLKSPTKSLRTIIKSKPKFKSSGDPKSQTNLKSAMPSKQKLGQSQSTKGVKGSQNKKIGMGLPKLCRVRRSGGGASCTVGSSKDGTSKDDPLKKLNTKSRNIFRAPVPKDKNTKQSEQYRVTEYKFKDPSKEANLVGVPPKSKMNKDIQKTITEWKQDGGKTHGTNGDTIYKNVDWRIDIQKSPGKGKLNLQIQKNDQSGKTSVAGVVVDEKIINRGQKEGVRLLETALRKSAWSGKNVHLQERFEPKMKTQNSKGREMYAKIERKDGLKRTGQKTHQDVLASTTKTERK